MSTARAEAEKRLEDLKSRIDRTGIGEKVPITEHEAWFAVTEALSLSEENARLRKERDDANRAAELTKACEDMEYKRAEAVEAKLSGEKYPNLDAAFLATMNEIGQYGFDKYREESFQHKRLTGDRTRHMERIYPDSLSLHAIEHFEMYLRGEIHDHFKTLKHQLAAVAFNAMMEFYFAGLEVPPPPSEAEEEKLNG